MRPRHKTAENPPSGVEAMIEAFGFNEAAAQNRGKPRDPDTCTAASIRFNEAAAQNRGKHPGDGADFGFWAIASMRPRHKTAENTVSLGDIHSGAHMLQ